MGGLRVERDMLVVQYARARVQEYTRALIDEQRTLNRFVRAGQSHLHLAFESHVRCKRYEKAVAHFMGIMMTGTLR